MSSELYNSFREHVGRNSLFRPGQNLLVAVSGGSDSVALLDLMERLAAELPLTLNVGHMHHGTGPYADQAEKVVCALAEHFALPMSVGRAELGAEWTETRARDARHEQLEKMRSDVSADAIVTGHHYDDQVETVMLRFLNGSGPAGLAGIQSISGSFVRPLLPFRKAQLGGYVRMRNLDDFVSYDHSNDDLRHDRNWVRGELLPLLERRVAGVRENIRGLADQAARSRTAWAAILRDPEFGLSEGDGWIEVARPPLARYDKVLSETLLQAVAREVGAVLGPKQSDRVRRFIVEGTSGHSVDVGDGWRFEINFDRVRLTRAPGALPADRAHLSIKGNGRIRWANWSLNWAEGIAENVQRAALSTWISPGDVIIRPFQNGDRISPVGGVGKRPVKKLLSEAKIPVAERGTYPVVERNGAVIWIPGICRAKNQIPEAGTRAIKIDVTAV